MLHPPVNKSKQQHQTVQSPKALTGVTELRSRTKSSAHGVIQHGARAWPSRAAEEDSPSRPLLGNQAILRKLAARNSAASLKPLRIQTKLEVNQLGDRYETEADRVADQVMRKHSALGLITALYGEPAAQRKCACGGSCSDCQAHGSWGSDLEVQTKSTTPGVGNFSEVEADQVADAVVATRSLAGSGRVQRSAPTAHEEASPARPRESLENRIVARQGRGSPLPENSRRFMENRFRRDFQHVRIHTDGAAHALNNDLHAYAFTTGSDIFFAHGQYRPGTEAGDRLLAHELTHVVQQGAAGEFAGSKWVQRAGFGRWAHNEIERRLIMVNPGLLAEVGIPGGTSGGSKFSPAGQGVGFSDDKFNIRGWADLYRAPDNIVPGVRAEIADKDDRKALGDNPPLKYLNIGDPGRTLGHATFAPKFDHTTLAWSRTPGFPKSFEIGEIKALFPLGYGTDLGDLATGKVQMHSYINGLEAFLPRVWEDSHHQTRDSTVGAILDTRGESGIVIPPEFDYARFDSQPATPDREMMILKGPVPKESTTDRRMRLWVHSIEPGVLNYFFLPHPFGNPRTRAETERVDGELYKLFKEIHAVPKGIPAKKAKPGSPPARSIVVQRQATPEVEVEVPDIPAPAGVEDMAKQTKWSEWEERRKQWAGDSKSTSGAKYFLKHTAKDSVDKLHIDRVLHVPSAESEILGDPAKVRQIQHWAGPLGKFMGIARFAFGGMIDKVQNLFAKVKTRKDAFLERVHVSEESTSGSWKRKALRVIGDIVVIFMKEIVGAVYSIAAQCVNGTFEAVIEEFKEIALDALQPVIGPILEKVQLLHEKIQDTFGPLIDEVESILEVLGQFRKWMDLASDIEWAIRLLIEALSCEVPPALGCIAGVLAQAGFSIAAVKAIGTNLFKRKIAQPVALSLVDSIAGSRIRGFISGIMSDIGLGDIVKNVPDCMPLPPRKGRRFDRDVTFDPNDPDFAASRFDLTGQYGDELIKDLEEAFGSNGQPASKEQVEDLVGRLAVSGLTIEEFRRKLKKEQGKYSISQALAVASPHEGAGGSETKPPQQQEEEEIDFSSQPKVSGNEPSSNSPEYGVLAQGDDSHHKGQNAVISVSIVGKKGPVAVLTKVHVFVANRETESDNAVFLTYSVREKRAFRLKGVRERMLLPDTLYAKLQPGSGSK